MQRTSSAVLSVSLLVFCDDITSLFVSTHLVKSIFYSSQTLCSHPGKAPTRVRIPHLLTLNDGYLYGPDIFTDCTSI